MKTRTLHTSQDQLLRKSPSLWLHRSIPLNKLNFFPSGAIICLLCRSKWFTHTNKSVSAVVYPNILCASPPELTGIAAQTFHDFVFSLMPHTPIHSNTHRVTTRTRSPFWKCKTQYKPFIAVNCNPYSKHEQTIKMLKLKAISHS